MKASLTRKIWIPASTIGRVAPMSSCQKRIEWNGSMPSSWQFSRMHEAEVLLSTAIELSLLVVPGQSEQHLKAQILQIETRTSKGRLFAEPGCGDGADFQPSRGAPSRTLGNRAMRVPRHPGKYWTERYAACSSNYVGSLIANAAIVESCLLTVT